MSFIIYRQKYSYITTVGTTLLDCTNLFPPNDHKENDKIIQKYFKDKYGRRSKSRFRLRKIDETNNYLL